MDELRQPGPHRSVPLKPRPAPAAGRPFPRAAWPRQRGITLFGLMFWAVLIGFFGYVLVRVLPTVNEYATIQRTVDTIAKGQPATVADARRAFDRQKDVEYSITSIAGKDLVVTKENDKVVIRYAYDREIPLYGPVYLVIKYAGGSR